MRIFIQMFQLWISFNIIMANIENSFVIRNQPIVSNSIQRFIEDEPTTTQQPDDNDKPLKKVFLSNRYITCNDGSQAGFYLRKYKKNFIQSTKWIIFLEGGWYCYDNNSCDSRWLHQRHLMTSSQWPDSKEFDGILSPYAEENPHWYNANHVFVPYCSSDSWSGTRKATKSDQYSFMGSAIVLQVIKDVVAFGLENSTDLLLVGSSAGGTGVMINLDTIQEYLHEQLNLKRIKVRGVTDSGWFLDRTPYNPQATPAVDAIRKGMDLWLGRVPRRCREQHLSEPWRCYFGYRIYPTIKTPLFVFQWLFDEAQIYADSVGAPVTKQQWDYVHKMGNALRHSFENVSAVFAPSCISHAVLTRSDFLTVKINGISVSEALKCWLQKTDRKQRRQINKKKCNRQKLTRPVNKLNVESENNNGNANNRYGNDEVFDAIRKRRKGRKRGNGNRRKGLCSNEKIYTNRRNRVRKFQRTNDEHIAVNRPWRIKNIKAKNKLGKNHCAFRNIEKCSWPQCNQFCPKLHDPVTGAEMDFLKLLKSFGVDMNNVASAMGIDVETLSNMDERELKHLLTPQTS